MQTIDVQEFEMLLGRLVWTSYAQQEQLRREMEGLKVRVQQLEAENKLLRQKGES